MTRNKETINEVKVAGSVVERDGRDDNTRVSILVGMDLGLKQDDTVIITLGPRGNVVAMQHVRKVKEKGK